MSSYPVGHIKNGMKFLREIFPDACADELNFCLFSTSGVHGSYTVIEEIPPPWIPDQPHVTWPRTVTFLVVHPRIVRLSYGNAEPKTIDDILFLKKLRQSSLETVSKIGFSDKLEAQP